MKRAALFLLLLVPAAAEDIRDSILKNPQSPYYVDFAHYPKADSRLPVGVFDSGTGGLTVLDAMLRYDEHRNGDGSEGADGVPDFATEDLIYLADQANMPYGNYPSVGKTDLLKEHVLKCAQFLLGTRYYADGPRNDKKPVKAIVIACNTATAYAKSDIEAMLQKAGSDLKVIGVIDAGARAALESLGPQGTGSIAIFATAGTVASGGYERALQKIHDEMGYTWPLQTYSQGGVGLAESIDEDSSYIDRKASEPRTTYKGPSLKEKDVETYRLHRDGLLMDADCSCVQINSPENYVRYHLVQLLETMHKDPQARPLQALILGCTHYPYMQAEIRQTLQELRQNPRYALLLAPQVALIDPAQNTARALWTHLHQSGLENHVGSWKNSEFYITVPNPETTPENATEAAGTRFTYDYKYGRSPGENRPFVRTVPFSRANIPDEVASRFAQLIPSVYSLIRDFDSRHPKTAFLPADQRL